VEEAKSRFDDRELPKLEERWWWQQKRKSQVGFWRPRAPKNSNNGNGGSRIEEAKSGFDDLELPRTQTTVMVADGKEKPSRVLTTASSRELEQR